MKSGVCWGCVHRLFGYIYCNYFVSYKAGCCMQHDILWDELTALEHMELFAGMKNIPKERVNLEIYSLLEQVQLAHVSIHSVYMYTYINYIIRACLMNVCKSIVSCTSLLIVYLGCQEQGLYFQWRNEKKTECCNVLPWRPKNCFSWSVYDLHVPH